LAGEQKIKMVSMMSLKRKVEIILEERRKGIGV
jgi:hypothetical protein